MNHVVAKLNDYHLSQSRRIGGVCIGSIINISPEGRAVVDYPYNPGNPVEARSIVDYPCGENDIDGKALPVLLVFENNDPQCPIIVGFVKEALFSSSTRKTVALPDARPDDAIIDGNRIVFDAEKEIVLQCGRSSVTLNKSGKVVIKGVAITSRAARVNKIKGAAVNIN